MLTALLLLTITAVLITAEQVPCVTGEQQCNGHQSLSVVNNKYYCCDHGFNVQWKSQASNDTSPANCVCDRQFYEIDCIEGNAQCQDATSFMSDGYTTKCCKPGYSMNSVSNSFINGVKVDYCKCTRYGSFGRPMTEAEKAQFNQAMSQFSHGLQTGLNQMQHTLSRNLGSLNEQLGSGFLSGLTDGLRRSLNSVANQFGASALRSGNITQVEGARNIAQPVLQTPPLTSRTWDLRQQRFQQLQRRLQQRPLNPMGPTVWDRLSRNSGMNQMMNPGWWLGQNWRGMFESRNQTTQNVNRNRTNDGNTTVPTALPSQNTSVKV